MTAPWPPGNGPRADAMVTVRPDIALGIITADCAPVLLADTEAGVAGAAHAGWRGAAAGVIEATVAAMIATRRHPGRDRRGDRTLHRPELLRGRRRTSAMRSSRKTPDMRRFFAAGRREAHWQFDLAGYCAARLAATGVRSVSVLGLDTAADEAMFFSYRRRTLGGGGPIGHQISVIALDPR